MTVTILRGDTAALPAAERIEELLSPAGPDPLLLACTDGSAAYRVLRSIMDYGYMHQTPKHVQLVCADEGTLRSFTFQWNMWFAVQKPEHDA